MEYDWINAADYAKPLDKQHMEYLEGTAFKVRALYGCELNSIETTVSYLQDVLKDPERNVTILVRDFGHEVADAVNELTQQKGVGWKQYICGLTRGSLPWKVKVAAISHSLDEALKGSDKYKIKICTYTLHLLFNVK